MEPVLKSLTLKNYRSVVAERIEFDNPTFLVGPNASGKSNVVDAIAFLAEIMTEPLPAVFDRRGGADRVRNTLARFNSDSLALGAEISGADWTANYGVEIQVYPGGHNRIGVIREQCAVESGGERHWFDRRDGTIQSNIGAQLDPHSSYLAMPVLGGLTQLNAVLQVLMSMRVYAIRPDSMRKAQSADSGQVLLRDGSNIASVLESITSVHSPEDSEARLWEELWGPLRVVLPGFHSVKPISEGGKLTLEFRQKFKNGPERFDASAMSDGTMRALGVLAALLQKQKPSVLVIEEPEASIHPAAAMGIMQDILHSYSEDMQIIVTSHSTDLLDTKWIGDRHLRVVSWEDGETRVTGVSKGTRNLLDRHLAYAGEALRTNMLHAPDPLPPSPEDLHLFQELP
jgi:predicted ATPase